MVMRSLGSEQTAIDDLFGRGFMGTRLSPGTSPSSLGDGGDPRKYTQRLKKLWSVIQSYYRQGVST